MLHRSFKPAKCKTSLKLASSRIKLMKNKKGVQINQIKKDLAQLLESGQDRTARIRVEHAIREEKMVAAYDLIEIYCELIVARLPIVESQKACPIDLKEAITSVIFAAPRCSDIPELLDIRKHFTAKYGKEFITAAIELRPDCGVSRMLVEKLSAVAPDLKTKVKVLSDVAKEHNIKWDPTSFEEKESKPPDDLLNGPKPFEKPTMANVDPPKVQSSNVHAMHSHAEKHDAHAPVDFSQQNRRFTLGSQNTASMDAGSIETTSAATRADVSSSGRASERMDVRQSFPQDGHDSPSYRQNWNMEFKDATSAAQAAAESAERASMAARAAAQLSSQGKITKQYSAESQESNFRNEGAQGYATSEFPGQHHSRGSYNSSFNDRKPKIKNKQIDPSENDTSPKATERFYGDNHGSTKRYNTSASLRSNNGSIEDKKMANNFQRADVYFQESSHKDLVGPPYPETSRKEEFKDPRAELQSHRESPRRENSNNFVDEVIQKQSSISSSHSRSSTFSDELDVSNSGEQKFGKTEIVGNPFAVVDQGNIFRQTAETSPYVDAASDDNADSDDDGPRFDTGLDYDEDEAKAYFPSPGRGSPTHPSESAHTFTRNMSNTVDHLGPQSHLFSESRSFSEHSVKSVVPSEPDDHMPVSFDHSDGPDSESESEQAKSSFSEMKDFTASRHKQDIFFTDPELAHVESSPRFNSRKSRIELNDLMERGSSFNYAEVEEKSLQSQQPSSLPLRHKSKDNHIDPQSHGALENTDDHPNQPAGLDSGKELNFGTLIGGLRNKGGLTYPPYTKSAAVDSLSSSKKSVEESSTRVDHRSSGSSFNSRVSSMENRKPSVSTSDSDSDDLSEKIPVKSPLKANKQARNRSQFSPPVSFLNDDATDSEEETPKQSSTSRVRLGSGVSRRTKGAPLTSYSKGRIEPEAKTAVSSSNEDKEPVRYSYNPAEPQSYEGKFKKEAFIKIPEFPISMGAESLESQAVEQRFIPSRKTAEAGKREAEIRPSRRSYGNETPPEPFKHEVFKAMPESKISAREDSIKVKSVEPPSNPPSTTAGKTEIPKTSNLSSETSSGENNVKKPSHVHPKLPDYDSLAARFQSLRTSRQ